MRRSTAARASADGCRRRRAPRNPAKADATARPGAVAIEVCVEDRRALPISHDKRHAIGQLARVDFHVCETGARRRSASRRDSPPSPATCAARQGGSAAGGSGAAGDGGAVATGAAIDFVNEDDVLTDVCHTKRSRGGREAVARVRRGDPKRTEDGWTELMLGATIEIIANIDIPISRGDCEEAAAAFGTGSMRSSGAIQYNPKVFGHAAAMAPVVLSFKSSNPSGGLGPIGNVAACRGAIRTGTVTGLMGAAQTLG